MFRASFSVTRIPTPPPLLFGFLCFSVLCAGAGCLILVRPLCPSAADACGLGLVGCLLAGWVDCLLAGWIGCLLAGWIGCLLAGWIGCLLAGWMGCLLAGWIGCLLAGWVGCLLAGWVGCLLAGWVGFTSYRWVVVRGFRKVTFFFGRQFIGFYLRVVLERMVSMSSLRHNVFLVQWWRYYYAICPLVYGFQSVRSQAIKLFNQRKLL